MSEARGDLEGQAENRYWSEKVSHTRWLLGDSAWASLVWHVLTLGTLVPLLLVVRLWSRRLRRSAGSHPTGKAAASGRSYADFMEIYPGCVYSPLCKGMELELFRETKIVSPVLEVGIGDGYFSSLVFGSKGQKLTFGADMILGTIRSAAAYSHVDRFLLMDAMEIPFPDDSLETVLMNNLIHHLPSRETFLKEAFRVLRPGGRLVLTENTLGWGLFTWEQALLRRLRLASLADRVLDWKLELFAQTLLVDTEYYEKLGNTLGFRVTRKVDFFSRSAMSLASLIEFLQLKQGQPTRVEMRHWLRWLGGMDRLVEDTREILECLWSRDRELSEREGFAFQFYELEKLGSREGLEPASPAPAFVCPGCKTGLRAAEDAYACDACGRTYPLVDGIPLLISYHDQVTGLAAHIEQSKRKPARKFVT